MPAGRILLKSISDSKKLSNLKTDGSRLLYTWLLAHLDVNGCFSGDAQVVRNKVLTRLNISVEIVEGYLQNIEENNLIIRYEANGDIFLIVPDFREKQPSLNPLKEGKPFIPLPTPDQLPTNSEVIPDQLLTNSALSKVKESKVNVLSDKIEEIFNLWNSLKIIQHRKITNSIKSSLIARLKDYSKDEIKQSINNYKSIIEDPNCYFKYRWTLGDFLSRGEGKNIDRFLDLKQAKENFSNGGQQNKGVRVYE